ncbi:uncharacterized protein C2845_PM01G15950 [Panicum miliaceum]|uniref:Uncharacterized protein n=1 Tax=Panicum miliaceum TaxID=4540 RepID=A0A3L6TL69_PANMI|nr:uncharacterized protein C2845_PM01G15950 [Panicum miliaceum]
MEPSGSNHLRVLIGGITNDIFQGNQDNNSQQSEDGDRNARKRQRERERYASMSTEKREERNRKQCERYKANKNRDDLSAQFATQDEDLNVLSEQIESSHSRVPLGDITNSITQGKQDTNGSQTEDGDRNARKRQRERERYASMSTEKREEGNRKQRER